MNRDTVAGPDDAEIKPGADAKALVETNGGFVGRHGGKTVADGESMNRYVANNFIRPSIF